MMRNNNYNVKISARYWKQILNQGGISKEEVDQLKSIDPTTTFKYLDWLTKIWIKEHPDINSLRNYIEEFEELSNKHRVEGADINSFPTFEALRQFVDTENDRASATLSELENDYEVIRDDADVFIAVPYTHAASRKLGLKYFGTRNDNTCSWCTTYKNNSHFNSYFYNTQATFYYVKVRNLSLIEGLHTKFNLQGVAIVVHSDGRIEAYDSNDSIISQSVLNKFRKVIGI